MYAFTFQYTGINKLESQTARCAATAREPQLTLGSSNITAQSGVAVCHQTESSALWFHVAGCALRPVGSIGSVGHLLHYFCVSAHFFFFFRVHFVLLCLFVLWCSLSRLS